MRTRGIPLTGADHLHLSLEHEARHEHDASHLAQLVMRLGSGFDPDAFAAVVERAYREIPFLHASIRPRWGGLFGPSVYHAPDGSGPVPIHDHGTPPGRTVPGARDVPRLFQDVLNVGPLDLTRDPLIRFDLVRSGDHTDLAVTWLFMLFDGHGLTRFIRLLARMADRPAAPPPIDWRHEMQTPVSLPGPLERMCVQREWADDMKELSDPSPGSPAGPIRPVSKRLAYEVTRFSPEDTDRFDRRARDEAGVLSPMLFYLALSLRAHHRMFRMRSRVPDQYLVPVAVDLRRRAKVEPVFRNHVSFLWFKVSPSRVNDRGELIDRLAEQKRNQVQSGFPRRMAIAMENNRYIPARINRRIMRKQAGGELCSFFFAYTGELFEGVSGLCGGEIVDGFPAAGVPPSPGSSFLWSLVRGRLTLTHVFQHGVLTKEERKAMKAKIRNEV